MKRNLSAFLILIFSLILVSCNSSNEESANDPETIAFRLQDAEPVKFDSIFIVEELIPFTDSERIPITGVKRILSREKNFWVLTSERILYLDSNGKILKIISNQGQGPGEYQSLDDIRWNKNRNLLEVLDKKSGKLLRFNDQGELQNEWENPYLHLATSFIPTGDDYFIYGGIFFNGDGDRAVLVSGKTGVKKNGYSKIGQERNYLSILNNDTFYTIEGEFEFFYSDSDTLFTLTEKGAKTKYFFDFGEFQTPKEFFNGSFDNIMDFRNQAASKNYASVFSIQPTDQYLFLFIIQGSTFYTGILDRATNRVRLTNGWSTEFGSDFSNLSSYMAYTPIGSDSEFLYFSIDPYSIKSEIDKLNTNPLLPEFLEANPLIDHIYQNFNDYENPYLMKIRINDL